MEKKISDQDALIKYLTEENNKMKSIISEMNLKIQLETISLRDNIKVQDDEFLKNIENRNGEMIEAWMDDITKNQATLNDR